MTLNVQNANDVFMTMRAIYVVLMVAFVLLEIKPFTEKDFKQKLTETPLFSVCKKYY